MLGRKKRGTKREGRRRQGAGRFLLSSDATREMVWIIRKRPLIRLNKGGEGSGRERERERERVCERESWCRLVANLLEVIYAFVGECQGSD